MKATERLAERVSAQMMIKCEVCDSTKMDWIDRKEFTVLRLVEGWSVDRSGVVRCPRCKGKHAKH